MTNNSTKNQGNATMDTPIQARGGMPRLWTPPPLYLSIPLLTLLLLFTNIGCTHKPIVQVFPDEPVVAVDTVKVVEPVVEVPEVVSEVVGVPGVVYFGFDSYELDGVGSVVVEEWSRYLDGRGEVGVVLSGYCDDRGSDRYNFGLGQKRAVAVLEGLRGAGYSGKARCVSYGENNPVKDGCIDEDCWKLNRRVEVRIDE